MRAAEFNEGIYPIPAGQFRGGKSSLEIPQNFKNTLTKLPGGSGFVYTITPGGYITEITIWDPKGPDYINRHGAQLPLGQLIGKLEISSARLFPLPGAVQVEVITVDEDYRGQGIAKALYGIVLTIMKLPLVAGDAQTPGGRINWVSLASIPGVEVKGYVGLEKYELVPNMPSQAKRAEQNIDTIMGELGGDYIGRSPAGRHIFAMDVQPNTTGKELEAYVKTKMSKIYGNTKFHAGLYATWTGA